MSTYLVILAVFGLSVLAGLGVALVLYMFVGPDWGDE